MGKHHEWRKKAKRARRQRIRQEAAAARDLHLHLTQQEYEVWLKEQEALEQFEYEHILKSNNEESEKWCKAVQQADEMWSRMQREKDRLRIAELEQETKRQLEWEQEKEKRRKEQERLKEIEEENKRKHEMFMTQLEQFLAGDSREPPPELLIARETRPECDPCPFFTKTSCCRFGDQCSRNHKYPGISCVLLATNFFAHFGLDNASFSEYDTDVMLEYEDSDTYKVFKDFFYDVVPEFEKFGRVTQFKVCHNFEKHLRGNTYVEFAEVRCAVAAYRALHSRWYGGKQLSLQFCLISSWKNAICGLQPKKRCPKGRSCNFLHVFKNPGNKCNSYESESREHSNQSQRSQSWRWSVSPEVEITERSWERFSRSRSSRHSTPRERHRRRSRSTHRKRRKSKSRSRSKERRRSKSRERRKHRRKGRENRENCVKSSGKENIQNSHFDRNSSERKSNVT